MTDDAPLVTVLPRPTAGLAAQPIQRPDGGWMWPVAGPRTGASLAGLAVDVRPAGPAERADELTDVAVAALGPRDRLVDRASAVLAGADAVRLLVLAEAAGPVCVVLEQWRAVLDGSALVVTATADLAAWAQLAPVLRAAVADLAVAPPR